jgi:hypothetical protein
MRGVEIESDRKKKARPRVKNHFPPVEFYFSRFDHAPLLLVATHDGWDVGVWEAERRRENENNCFSRFERHAPNVLSRQSEKSKARIQPIGRILRLHFVDSLHTNYIYKRKLFFSFRLFVSNITRDNKRCWDPEGMLIYCCAMRSSTSSAIRTEKSRTG